MLAFKGDVYTGLQADTLTKDELAFAQKHLRILSGLYGLLRPLDLMQPYRLEMGLPFANAGGKNLYEFWGDQITETLGKHLKASGSQVLVNLASNEYFKAVAEAVGRGGDHPQFSRPEKWSVQNDFLFRQKGARGDGAAHYSEWSE